jgi:hypothetical protein
MLSDLQQQLELADGPLGFDRQSVIQDFSASEVVKGEDSFQVLEVNPEDQMASGTERVHSII